MASDLHLNVDMENAINLVFLITSVALMIPLGTYVSKYGIGRYLKISLLLMTIGLLLSAFSTDINMLLFSRFIQGNAKKEVEIKEFDASAYDVTIENAIKEPITDAESYNEAIEILTSYLEGDKTEDQFAALAKLHTDDSNGEQGGLYEDVPVGQMVSEFEGWALAEGREAGDVGIVETTYGYHIMYHVAKNVTTWADAIKADLATEEYAELYEELIAGENVAAGEMNAEMKADIAETMDAFAKNIYNNYMNYYSSYTGY